MFTVETEREKRRPRWGWDCGRREPGYTVIIAQFLKSSETSELNLLDRLGITVLRVEESFGFTWELSSGELERLTLRHNELFRQAIERCGDGERKLLILDELARRSAQAPSMKRWYPGRFSTSGRRWSWW